MTRAVRAVGRACQHSDETVHRGIGPGSPRPVPAAHYAFDVEFRVLGTIEVDGPAPTRSPPGAKERAILARLLIDAGRTVPADALLDAGWDDVPREVAARSLAVRVANLRAFLEPGRERGAPSSLLVREEGGGGAALARRPRGRSGRRRSAAARGSLAPWPPEASAWAPGRRPRSCPGPGIPRDQA